MKADNEGLIVVRLLNEARRKSDGTVQGMTEWLERRKSYMADDADTRHHDKALDVLALDNEVVLAVPRIILGSDLKAGMVVEANRDFTVTLTKDSYIDPADDKLTIYGTRSDTGADYCAVIEAKAAYFVQEPPTPQVEPPTISFF